MISGSINYFIVVGLSVIANLATAFLLYYIFQIEINLYSLAGITISLGLIMDNALVMIDHVRNQGDRKVFLPILAATLTSIGALSIIFFLEDEYKTNLVDFAWVIIINLSISLFVGLFLIPALIKKIPLRKSKKSQALKVFKNKFYFLYDRFIHFVVKKKLGFTVVAILLFGIPFFMLPQKIESGNSVLKESYNMTIGSPWFRENIRPGIDTYLGGTLRLFSIYVFEATNYTKNEETTLFVNASMEKGATVHQMNEVYLQIESYLGTLEEIKQFNTIVYSGQYASMEITFNEPFNRGSFPFLLKTRLSRKAINMGGIDWNIYGVGNGFNNANNANEPINFRVEAKGYNYEELNKWAEILKTRLASNPRVKNSVVRENSPIKSSRSFEYVIDLNKPQLSLQNIQPLDVYSDLKALTLSKYSSIYLNIEGNYIPIRLEEENSESFGIWQIKNETLGDDNRPYNLRASSEIKKTPEDENIFKENQEYIRLVEFQYAGSEKFGDKLLENTLNKVQDELPLGFSFESLDIYTGLRDKESNSYIWLLILIFIIIFTVCAVLFESFSQPFIILSVVPISYIGVFSTFYLFDFNFDQGGMASFILLSGITVNASIFIVDSFNKVKKEYPRTSNIKAYLIAFKRKIFPIILTMLSTILGFIPFVAFGQNEIFWFALGVGTIGGLMFSLIAILIYLPMFSLNKGHVLSV
jgi:multidrug efflux pump subunit AcrB